MRPGLVVRGPFFALLVALRLLARWPIDVRPLVRALQVLVLRVLVLVLAADY